MQSIAGSLASAGKGEGFPRSETSRIRRRVVGDKETFARELTRAIRLWLPNARRRDLDEFVRLARDLESSDARATPSSQGDAFARPPQLCFEALDRCCTLTKKTPRRAKKAARIQARTFARRSAIALGVAVAGAVGPHATDRAIALIAARVLLIQSEEFFASVHHLEQGARRNGVRARSDSRSRVGSVPTPP